MKRLLNYIKNLFTTSVDTRLADALSKLDSIKCAKLEDDLYKLTAKKYADLEMESEGIEYVEDDCFVIMSHTPNTQIIEYVFYDRDKREISVVDDIDSCSHFKLTEYEMVQEVIVSMVSVGMRGLPCLLRTRNEPNRRLLECVSFSLETLIVFSKKESNTLMN